MKTISFVFIALFVGTSACAQDKTPDIDKIFNWTSPISEEYSIHEDEHTPTAVEDPVGGRASRGQCTLSHVLRFTYCIVGGKHSCIDSYHAGFKIELSRQKCTSGATANGDFVRVPPAKPARLMSFRRAYGDARPSGYARILATNVYVHLTFLPKYRSSR